MNQPPENWILVFKSPSEYEVNIVKAMLADHDIVAEMISDADHSIDALNINREAALYVHKQDLDAATRILKQSER
jgi:type III secretory pathway lipoprotein EscJ